MKLFDEQYINNKTMHVQFGQNPQDVTLTNFRENMYVEVGYQRKEAVLQKMKKIGELLQGHQGVRLSEDLQQKIKNIIE